jgi:hypothetical protein
LRATQETRTYTPSAAGGWDAAEARLGVRA